MQVVIPAAGLGRRFGPLGLSLPKELLPLAGRPLIHHALEEAAQAGFEAALIVISPAKQAIRDCVASIDPPLPIGFLEQPAPLGLGDAVRRCRRRVDEPFAVLLPDDVVPESEHWSQLQGAHRSTAAAALCIRPIPIAETGRFGIALCHEEQGWLRIDELVEKPAPGAIRSNLAILGRYVVSSQVLDALERLVPQGTGELELTSGFAAVLHQPPGVVAVLHDGEVFDCGTPDDYQRSLARQPAWAANAGVR